jgi:Fibronectin type III domain
MWCRASWGNWQARALAVSINHEINQVERGNAGMKLDSQQLARYGAAAVISMMIAGCGGGGTSVSAPGTPTAVSVAVVPADTTSATVSFTAPASSGGSTITGYTVTANPGGITATGTASPITITGLTPHTAYTYSVVATNAVGDGAAASTGSLNFYSIVETFHEPMTFMSLGNETIFTGTFTYDTSSQTVSNLAGSLSESMTGNSLAIPPVAMTTVALGHQLSSVSDATLGGLLITTFAQNSVNTLDVADGFTPDGTAAGMKYYGYTGGTANPGNAYAMIFVNTTDPATALTQAQIDKLSYADCTAGGMMMSKCMTGTTVAGYGSVGSMNGYPQSQVITKE